MLHNSMLITSIFFICLDPHSDAQLKVYLMHLRNQQPNLFGGPRHSERELDAEHIFVHNQTEALVGQLQPLIDDWTVKNSYLDDEEEGDSEVE